MCTYDYNNLVRDIIDSFSIFVKYKVSPTLLPITSDYKKELKVFI